LVFGSIAVISTELNDIATTLEARSEAFDPLAPAEWAAVVRTLRSLAERAAQMEDRPIPEVKWSNLQRGLVVIDGGKTPLTFQCKA
jgi:hypothetical protein